MFELSILKRYISTGGPIETAPPLCTPNQRYWYSVIQTTAICLPNRKRIVLLLSMVKTWPKLQKIDSIVNSIVDSIDST